MCETKILKFYKFEFGILSIRNFIFRLASFDVNLILIWMKLTAMIRWLVTVNERERESMGE